MWNIGNAHSPLRVLFGRYWILHSLLDVVRGTEIRVLDIGELCKFV
jgi:hypothetical protein